MKNLIFKCLALILSYPVFGRKTEASIIYTPFRKLSRFKSITSISFFTFLLSVPIQVNAQRFDELNNVLLKPVDFYRSNLEEMELKGKVRSIEQHIYELKPDNSIKNEDSEPHYIKRETSKEAYLKRMDNIHEYYFGYTEKSKCNSIRNFENAYLTFNEKGYKTELRTYKYDPLTEVEFMDYRTTYSYDDMGNLLALESFNRDSILEWTMYYSYDDFNQLISEVVLDSNGHTEWQWEHTNFYNDQGRLTKVIHKYLDKEWKCTKSHTFKYNSTKRSISEKQKEKCIENRSKPHHKYELKKTKSSDNIISYLDEQGRVVKQIRYGSNDNNHTIFAYDGQGRKIYQNDKLFVYEKGVLVKTMEILIDTYYDPVSNENTFLEDFGLSLIHGFFGLEYDGTYNENTPGTLLTSKFEYDALGNWIRMTMYFTKYLSNWPLDPAIPESYYNWEKNKEYDILFYPIFIVQRDIEYYPEEDTMRIINP